MKVRPTQSRDIPALETILSATGLFPTEMLPELIQGFLSGEVDDEHWLTCELDGTVIGFCYAVQEQLTEGTWNMRAIGVLPGVQHRGAGSALVAALQGDLKKAGHRVLILDTSGAPEFLAAQKFYRACGFTEEARIRDFWTAGEDKIVFWKAL